MSNAKAAKRFISVNTAVKSHVNIVTHVRGVNMKVHPEVKELMTEAMEEGLKHWKNKTPEQIRAAVRARLLADSKVFKTPLKGIEWKYEMENCQCPTHPFVRGHMPWCEGVRKIVFVTPEPERKGTLIDGRMWDSGPGMFFDGGIQP